MTPTEHARLALLNNLAHSLAGDATDALEPLAGRPIGEDTRQALAAEVLTALVRHVPALVNVRHAMR